MIMTMTMILQIIITVTLIWERKALLVNSDISGILTSVRTFDLYYNKERWTQIPVSRSHTAVSASLSHAAGHSAVTPGRCVHSAVSTPSSATILPTPNIRQLLQVNWIEQGLTSHQTHYRSYRGRVFTGQMTLPTVSKHWRKIGSKHQASIPSGPPHHAHNNTTTMQYKTTHKIRTDKCN